MRAVLGLLPILILVGCGDDDTAADGGTSIDSGAMDAGDNASDGGQASDGGDVDAGQSIDAGDSDGATVDAAASDGGGRSQLSFFITSVGSGDGGNLGGLAGADDQCQMLADAVGASDRTWRAYLSQSATGGARSVNARDRIGTGPWFNADGVMIAADVRELHGDNNLDGTTALTENGDPVPGRGAPTNQHDILTGSTSDGMAYPADPDRTCANWTSNDQGSGRVGHHDRVGGGADPTSWNSAHDSRGCSQADLVGTGGNGYFYCFAAD